MSSTSSFDVVVIGGGPAGIAAAWSASQKGARVAVIDEGSAPGGQIWREKLGVPASGVSRRWKQRLVESPATVLSSTSVVDVERKDDQFSIIAERGGSALRVAGRSLILATGARERFLPFPGWTLPNVVGVGGGQALLKTGMSVAGKRVVVAGSGPLLLPVAASLAAAGAKLALVAEQTSLGSLVGYASSLWRTPTMLAQAARLRAGFLRTRYATGTWVTRAEGEQHVKSVTVTDGRSSRVFACDLLCVAYGLMPNTELARLLGCEVSAGAVVVDEQQATSQRGIFCAGEPTGIGGVDLALVEGEIAGNAAAEQSVRAALSARRRRLRAYATRLERAFAPRREVMTLATSDTIVCRCEDVRLGDLQPEWTSRQAKLYTRAGMGACQGRICGGALECVMGWRSDSVRPPIQPARLATLLTEAPAHEPTQGAP